MKPLVHHAMKQLNPKKAKKKKKKLCVALSSTTLLKY